MRAMYIDLNNWESLASERPAWRHTEQKGLCKFEETVVQQAGAKENEKKGTEPVRETSASFHLHSVREGLPFPKLACPATPDAVSD